ncbi:MAG: SRPBCC domain-containing protein [Chitinophagaceae bacterium]|nr:MAG: SRPBCC domain-containing protein [Chitinophagaceae bacterium]
MNEPLVFERVYDATPAEIWNALTDPEQMRQWYFDIPGFRAEPGFEFSFIGGDETTKFTHLCRVTEAVPNQKLAYTWRYAGYPGDSLVSFELFDLGGGQTKLRLTHSGLETITPHHEGFKRENFREGWTYFSEKALPQFLAK